MRQRSQTIGTLGRAPGVQLTLALNVPLLTWALVLFFSGLSFAGYVARRVLGDRAGFVIVGMPARSKSGSYLSTMYSSIGVCPVDQ